MIKKAVTFLLLFFLVLLIVTAAPLLLGLERVKKSAINTLEHQLDASVQIEKIRWIWLPLPHLSLSKTDAATDTLSIKISEIKLYPAWDSFIWGKLAFRKIVLKKPLIHYSKAESSGKFKLPRVHLVIEDGTLNITPIANFFTAEKLSFSHITGQLELRPEMVNMDFEFTSPLCQTSFVIGTYRPETQEYNLLLRSAGLNLAQCIARLTTKKITFDETGMAIQATISGTGLDSFKASFAGMPPSLIVDPMDKKKIILMGSSDFSIEKTSNDFTVDINVMEFIQPDFTLKGIIKRSVDTVDDQSVEPTWLLDLTADDINLSQVRDLVLTLWGKSRVAQQVCDIVQGGTAKSARYRFNEKVSGFAFIENMDLEVDIASASINVPKTGLHLTNGSGSIAIKDGILTGQNLTAHLEESKGTSGSIFLDFKKNGDAFQLNLDIDSDLSALPPILDRLVQHEGFRNELHQFNQVSGRAQGHLRMGESFADLNTYVTVSNVQAETYYDRIHPTTDTQWKIIVDYGELQVLPEEVHWKNVSAIIGNQKILDMQGSVDWHADVLLNIERMDALLESTSLYEKLLEKKIASPVVADALSFVTGEITLTDGSFHGSPSEPNRWQYSMSVSSPEFRSSSPLLPAFVFTKTLSATISEKLISLPETSISFMGQPLTLRGDFHHENLDHWQGDIHITGGINEDIANWLVDRWLPSHFSPHLPAIVPWLNLSWDKNKIEMDGMLHADTLESLPSFSFSLLADENYLQLKNAVIKGLQDEGRLTFDQWKTSPEHFLLTWKGKTDHHTLDTLLTRTPFLTGTIEGNFKFSGSHFPQITSFDGHAQLGNLQWPLGEESISASIKKLSLSGATKQVDVNEIFAAIGQESIQGKGKIVLSNSGPELDIDIVSDFFTQNTISRFISKLAQPEQNKANETKSPYGITGRIGFSIDSYSLENKPPLPAPPEGKEIAPVTALNGRIKLFPEKRNALFLNNANFCGLSVTGSWYSESSMADDTLTLTSSEPLLFEEFLPCLNISQDIIKGNFIIDTNIKGSGSWSKGSLTLDSDKGRILRMTLLAQLFRIINITDLFTALELKDYEIKGFPYSKLELLGHLDENRFIIQRLVILGEGLNIFGRGSVNLSNLDTDITLLIAPLKTVDAIVSNVPLIGPAVTGQDKAIATIPVSIKGSLLDPTIIILPPEAIGDAVLNVVKETLMLPFTILKPILKDSSPQ